MVFQAKWFVGWQVFFLAVCITLSAQAQTIHVLIVADTNIYGDNQYGLCAQVDLERLSHLFRCSVGTNHLDLRTLSGAEVSEESILRAIDQFECDEADGLVFLWAGHGQYDSQGHHFQLPHGGKLYRATVVEHVRRRGAGTDAVLSSSCNVRPAGEAAAMKAPLQQVGPGEIRPLFRSLFLDARGLVDINGANTDQCTVGVIGLGTSFFIPFQQVMIENIDSRLSWSEFAPRLKQAVEAFFRDHYPDGIDIPGGRQYSQTPKFYALPGQPTQLPEVLGLTANDIILSINGRAVSGGHDCIEAINQSGDTMEFTVRDSRDGNVWRMRTTLRRTPPRFGVHVVDAPGGAHGLSPFTRTPPPPSIEYWSRSPPIRPWWTTRSTTRSIASSRAT